MEYSPVPATASMWTRRPGNGAGDVHARTDVLELAPAVRHIGREGALAAVESADGGAHALVLEAEAAARARFAAERLQALQEAKEAVLAVLEHLDELALPALGDEGDRMQRLVNHRVVRRPIRGESRLPPLTSR